MMIAWFTVVVVALSFRLGEAHMCFHNVILSCVTDTKMFAVPTSITSYYSFLAWTYCKYIPFCDRYAAIWQNILS